MFEKCDTCNGAGEIGMIEEVCAGEPQTRADVGSRPCPDCQSNDDEDDDGDR